MSWEAQRDHLLAVLDKKLHRPGRRAPLFPKALAEAIEQRLLAAASSHDPAVVVTFAAGAMWAARMIPDEEAP